MILKNLVTIGIIGISAIGCERKLSVSVNPESYYYERYDVDQVFRDHNGYRLIWDDSTGLVREKKYFSNGGRAYLPFPDSLEFNSMVLKKHKDPVAIIKDLEPEQQGYAEVVYYNVTIQNPSFFDRFFIPTSERERGEWLYYVEVHLPKNQSLSPGEETYGWFKSPQHSQMREIK